MPTIRITEHSDVNIASCSTCCCELVGIAPGETSKWYLLYGDWTRSIGGRGITANTSFDIQKKPTAPALGANQPPVPGLFLGVTPFNTSLIGVLTAADADSNPLAYAALPLYGPTQGSVVVSASGTFTYTPNPNFTGYDRFFYTVADAFNSPVVGEAIIGVSPASGPTIIAPAASMATPTVAVKPKNVKVDSIWQSTSFPLEVSPQARVGDIYRMVIRQHALDCDTDYYRLDCFDLFVSSCGV
jgi:hypothetical protein